MIHIKSSYDRFFTLLDPPVEWDIDELAEEFAELNPSRDAGTDDFIKWLIANKGFKLVSYETIKYPFG